MINIFFQEWAPLFPILHRPTFLSLYEQYVASPDTMSDKKSIAQLNLVFGIAALSSDVRIASPCASHYVLTSSSLVMVKTSNHSRLSGRALSRAS
jgi:hypothetical protein